MKYSTAYVIFFMATFALCLPLIAQNADFMHLKFYAEDGNADAQLKFGQAYASGIDVPKDATESVKWYTKSAEQGNAEAQFHLGEAFLNGEGVEKDAIDAYAYLNLAAITLEKARASRSGLELEMTKEQIAAGQRKSKELKERIRQLADEERLRKAAEEQERLRKAAEEQERLRKAAEEQERLRKAAEEQERLRKAAEEQERLRKAAEEQERLRKAAEKQERLRKAAEEQERLRKAAEEQERLRKAAEEEKKRKEVEEESKRKEVNEKERPRKIAEEVRIRKVTENDEPLRIRMAAEQGNASAQCELGDCYSIGKGVAKDEVEAVKWYLKAAEQGSIRAHSILGYCYANGKGVAKDEVEAYARYCLAGNISGINRLKEKFTWYQLAKGQKRTKELQSQIARSKGE
jgi:TPR repeat protein